MGDCLAVICNFECGALGIMDLPKHDRVDIHRHRVLAQCLFGVDFGGLNALIEPRGHVIDERHNCEQSRTANCVELA